MEESEKSRISDLGDEPVDRLLIPIKGYEKKPLVSLAKAIEPVSTLFNDVQDYVYIALHNCQNPSDGLDQQESAAIHLYTMQFPDGPSLYDLLNQSLRTEDRGQLQPWFPFLKLFLTALHKLPSEPKTVWRGIKDVDLSSKYRIGTKFAWWGVSSCTTHLEVLDSKQFLGKDGERTIFAIECRNGKSIVKHSHYKNKEKEVILIPGTYFEVIGQLNPVPQLHIIQLREITPPITLIASPFPKSTFVTDKSNTSSEIILNMNQENASTNISSTDSFWKPNNTWKQVATSVAGGYGQGSKLNQLDHPFGMCIDDDQTIYIADYVNHRIVAWKSNTNRGHIVAGGHGPGKNLNQLNYPTDVIIDKQNNSLIIADSRNNRIIEWSRENTTNGEILISNIQCWGIAMDKNGFLYIADCEQNAVRRWKRSETNEIIVAGGNGRGCRNNQLNLPTYIFVDDDYSLYVSDYHNHRVMKWMRNAREGIVAAGGNGEGNTLTQLAKPYGIVVNQLKQIYVVDSVNNRVMRWCKGDKRGTIVVNGNEQAKKSNQFCNPSGLSFDRQGNLYLVDHGNDRILKFDIE